MDLSRAQPRNPTEASERAARVLAVSEAQIPSAVLGVNAVFEHLGREGTCRLRTGSSVELDAADVAWADSILLVRGASPSELRLLRAAQRSGRFVATYMDDDLERVPADARSAYFFRSPRVLENLRAILTAADAIYVTSERLGARIAERHGRSPVLLRQPRPPRLPEESSPPAVLATDRGSSPDERGPHEDKVRLGFLGSVDHAGFLESLLAEPLAALLRRHPGRVELVFCGANPSFARALGARLESFELDFTAWRRRALGLGVHIGLAPLVDSPFHRCKYFNKYLEYGSLGIAGIYSNVAPSADAVVDGQTGLLCPNDPAAWARALDRLVGDPALRLRLARGAYDDVETRFSSAALAPAWRAALAPLLAHRAPEIDARALRLPRGHLRHGLDRLAVYGAARFAERVLGRLSGRLRPG